MIETQQGHTVSIQGSVRFWTGSPPTWAPQVGLEVRPLPHGSRHGAMSRSVMAGLSRLVDAAAVVAGSALGLMLSEDLHGTIGFGNWSVAAAFATVSALVILHSGGSYKLDRLIAPLTDVGTGITAVGLAMAVMGSSLFALEQPHLVSTASLACGAWGVTTFICLMIGRLLIGLRLTRDAKLGRLTRRIAIVGANDVSAAFIDRAESDAWTQIVGVFDDAPTSRDPLLVGAAVRGGVDDLIECSRRNRLDAVVLALPYASAGNVGALRRQLRSVIADIAVIAGSADLPASTGAITVVAGNPVVIVSHAPMQHWDAVAKTALDRLGSAWLLVVVAPLLLVIAALIKLESRGPVLFRQRREGVNNTLFTIYKFRTMTHAGAGADHGQQASKGDKRVTRVGAVLRRLSLDELPQLLNVLKGDMSLVGPRPHYPSTRAEGRLFHEIVPGYAARHRVKPGITGLAQVQGCRGETRTARDVADRVALDLTYIDRWSLRLDLRILVMTVLKEIVSSSGNAY